MAFLTQSGRTALAVSLKSQPLHMAWGTGDSAWESTFTQSFTFEGDRIQLPHAPIKQLFLAEASDGFDVNTQASIVTRTYPALLKIVLPPATSERLCGMTMGIWIGSGVRKTPLWSANHSEPNNSQTTTVLYNKCAPNDDRSSLSP